MNINFQAGKGTVITFTDEELMHARIVIQAMLESGILAKESKEKVLRIALQMQAIIFKRGLEQKERDRYKICEKCCTEIDTSVDYYITKDGSYSHQQCPQLKENRP